MLERLNKTYLAFACLLTPLSLYSQAPEIEWQRCLGGNHFDVFVDADEDANGNIGIVGITNSCDGIVFGYQGHKDILVIKLHGDGSIDWTKTWGGSKRDVPVQCAFNKKLNSLYVLAESNSTDGDLAFKKSGLKNAFFLAFKPDGTEAFNSKLNHKSGDLEIRQSAEKLILSKDYLPMVFLNYSPLDFIDENLTIFRMLNEDAVSPGHLEFELSIRPQVVAYLKANDFYYNQDDRGLAVAATVTDNTIFLKSRHEYDIEKITLKGTHKTSHNTDETSDACIFKITGGYYIAPYLSNNKCMGGLGEDTALKVFETSYLNYRLLVSSDSRDGDFEINHGGQDIWLVDLDKKLTIINRRNIGTPFHDKFLGVANLSNNIFTTLINADNVYSPKTPKDLFDKSDPKDLFDELKEMQLSPKIPGEKSYQSSRLLPDDNSPGLKLDISTATQLKARLNFNFSDNDASVWSIGNNQFVIAANKKSGNDNDACLIGVDANTGMIIWEKIVGGNGFDRIIKVIPAKEGGFYALGTTTSNNSGNVPQGNGESDIWIIKFNQKENIRETKTVFNDRLYDNTVSNKDSSFEINEMRLKALVTYQDDTSNIGALWTFAQTSEYLADYDIATKAYGLIISKLDKVKDKSKISKARAHQITCNFLLQSQKKDSQISIESNAESGNGFYGIGINYLNIGNHLMVSSVTTGKGAEKAGVKACDEIVNINGVAVASDCITPTMVKEKLRGEKDSYVILTVKRFGVKILLDLVVQRTFIPYPQSSASSENTIPAQVQSSEPEQQQSQTFLKKMVAAMQKDTVLMKSIETVKKVNYALAIINKWANSPVDNKYFEQIDEQLGLVTSLIGIIKGNNPNFAFDNNGKVSFGNPELKELAKTDYAKEAQTKYDAIAHTQEVKETKIDENITFVEKKEADYSGDYEIYEIVSSYPHQRDNQKIYRPGEREYHNTQYTSGYTEYLPLTIKVDGNNISTKAGTESYYSNASIKWLCEASGTISESVARLTGNCKYVEGTGSFSSISSETTFEQTIDFTNPNSITITSKHHCVSCGVGDQDSGGVCKIRKIK